MIARRLAVFVVLSVLVLSTFAAAPSRAQGTPTIAAAKCAAPGNLTMWVWDPNWHKVLDQATAAWIKDYCPGAKVDIVERPYDQYWTTVKTSATSGDLPDVFNMSQDNFVFYAQNNALLDLQPYFDKAGLKPTVWGKGLVDPYRWGANQDVYAAPLEWVTTALFYNKDMFDAAKVAYPTAAWTWDDFAKDAQALTDTAKDQYGAAVYMGYQTGYPNFVGDTGVSPVVDPAHTVCTLGEPGSVEALNFLKGLLDKGYMPKPSIMGGSGADDAFNFFINGKLAMVSGGSWKLPDAFSKVKFNWDVVQLPKYPKNGESRAILHATSWVSSAKTKNPDLAANLIIYLVSDEGQKFFAQGGGVAPSNPNPDLQKLWMDTFKAGKNVQAFVDATKDSQGVAAFGEIWDEVDKNIVVNIFDLGMPVDQAVKQSCDVINKFLTPATPAAK